MPWQAEETVLRDPDRVAAVRRTELHPALDFVSSGTTTVLRASPDPLDDLAGDAAGLVFLRSLEIGSVVVAPLRARGRSLGILVLVRDGGRDPFAPDETHVAELLAERGAHRDLFLGDTGPGIEPASQRRLLERFDRDGTTVHNRLPDGR